MHDFQIRLMTRDDWDNVAEVIYASLNGWYMKNRGFNLVNGPKETMLLFPRIYESLDPNCCFVAEERQTRRLAGSCFFHPRSTHVSLGIMNVHPDFFGQRVSSRLLEAVIDVAKSRNQPLRLVSSSMNLESFSLYNRYGLVPRIFFQDMTVTVPANGFPVNAPQGTVIRQATLTDLPEIVALEQELQGIEREKDFRFFLENHDSIWHMSVLVNQTTQKIDGVLVSVCDPGSHMLGPGVSRTEEQMAALIRAELNVYPERQPVWLIPTDCVRLREAMFRLGAKNCELHIAQSLGDFPKPTGVVLPTFMPETS